VRQRIVLIVDDDPEVRKVVAALLHELDYATRESRCATEALELIRTETPDIVLTDIIMPDGEGIELIQKVSRMVNPPKMVAMSGHPTGSVFLRAAELFGAAATLGKPFTAQELGQAMHQAERS
jgi:DNA-binding NtrC family response regulator